MMDFEEVKSVLNEVYDKKTVPKFEQVKLQFDGINSRPDRFFGNELPPYNYWELLADEKSIEGEWDSGGEMWHMELRGYYWDFAAKLFNDKNRDIGSFKKLLGDKSREMEQAYFLKTDPIKEFFIHDEIGKSIFDKYPSHYRALTGHLCSMDIHYFHEIIQDNEYIYNLFKDLETLMKVPGHKGGDKQLLFFTNHAKKIRLWYEDVNNKLRYINEVLNYALFHPEIKEIGKVKLWDKLTKEQQVNIGNEGYTGPGNPDIIDSKINPPGDFDSQLAKIMADNSNYTQEAMALEVIENNSDLVKRNIETVKGWIRRSKHWKNR